MIRTRVALIMLTSTAVAVLSPLPATAQSRERHDCVSAAQARLCLHAVTEGADHHRLTLRVTNLDGDPASYVARAHGTGFVPEPNVVVLNTGTLHSGQAGTGSADRGENGGCFAAVLDDVDLATGPVCF